MMELTKEQKFWIRGDKENPLGVIRALCERGVTGEVDRFAYDCPQYIFCLSVSNPFRSNKQLIEIRCLDDNTDEAEWLMAAWPEIKPLPVGPRQVGGFTIRPKTDNFGNCEFCQFRGLCNGGRIENKTIERLIYNLFGTLAPCWEEIVPPEQ